MKTDGCFAVSKMQHKVVSCTSFKCENCEFYEGCCERDKIKWLCKEWIPSVLSNDELGLIKAMEKVINKKYKYINNPRITLFTNKPFIHHNAFGYFYTSDNYFADISCKDGALFQNIENNSGVYDIESKIFIK